uniref:Uncharacterized protein n=1 Tax=Arundo donax TaxID=35708 RepID=A0A0A9FHP9_ARUDO
MMSLGFMMGITDSRSSRTTSFPFSFPGFASAIALSLPTTSAKVQHRQSAAWIPSSLHFKTPS